MGTRGSFSGFNLSASDRLVTPKASNRPPARVEVPKKFADEYLESCLVIADSPKAPPGEDAASKTTFERSPG